MALPCVCCVQQNLTQKAVRVVRPRTKNFVWLCPSCESVNGEKMPQYLVFCSRRGTLPIRVVFQGNPTPGLVYEISCNRTKKLLASPWVTNPRLPFRGQLCQEKREHAAGQKEKPNNRRRLPTNAPCSRGKRPWQPCVGGIAST